MSPPWWRTTAVTSAAGLLLTVVALVSAQLALPRDPAPHAAALLAAAAAVAVVAGALLGWTLSRAVDALEHTPDAAAALAARLPGVVTRAVAVACSAVAALAVIEALRHDGPPGAAWTTAASAASFLATASLAAALSTRAALRRRRLVARPRTRERSLSRRYAREVALCVAGAVGPAAALALGAGLPPGVILPLFALAVTIAAIVGRALGGEAQATIVRTAAELGALAADPRAPAPPAPAITREARGVAQAMAQLADRVTQLRLTRQLALQRALEAERLRTQFLANTSHELRSPLHAVLGYTDLLLRGVDGPLTDGQRQSLERIQQSGAHLLLVIQEVLDLARIDAGKLELVRMQAIPAELLEQAVEEARKRFPGVAIDVSTRVERGLPTLVVDQYRVVQALTYLVAYAVEAVTAGGKRKKARVQIGARRVERAGQVRCELAVAAPDATLAPDEHERLFDGFRLLTGRAGLGLGPHLARRFLELHGGDVTLAAPGQGVRFDVSLPVVTPPAPPPAPSAPPDEPSVPAPSAMVRSRG